MNRFVIQHYSRNNNLPIFLCIRKNKGTYHCGNVFDSDRFEGDEDNEGLPSLSLTIINSRRSSLHFENVLVGSPTRNLTFHLSPACRGINKWKCDGSGI